MIRYLGVLVVVGVLGACSVGSTPDAIPGGAAAGSGGSLKGGAGAGTSSSGATTGGSGGAAVEAGEAGVGADAGSGAGGQGTGGGGTGGGGTGGQGSAYWKPQPGLTWQWQLSETVTDPLQVDVYDVDWQADAAVVAKLHAAKIKVICYVSVGSWEDFRPDAKDFPSSVIGKDYEGWPGEKHVDIRSPELRAIISARFDVCKAKGFDAIEPDNMDVFELGADSGFPLTEADGIQYAAWLADQAHTRGMGIGQKNAASITSAIVKSYDWALTESCYSDGNWCADVESYVTSGKPVFMCEYTAKSFAEACGAWKPKGFSPILKNLDLDPPVTFCP